MTARFPGPRTQHTPIGFPPFNKHMQRDSNARVAFREGEVNNRIYKNVWETVGFKGKVYLNKKIGKNRIKIRDIGAGYSHGIDGWTRMMKMSFYQCQREGWMKMYGLVKHKFR
mmetsp:Transcript_16244/g.32921  ORF Transcript_16244/g.32921 Transcript_16244/m.32921 type:complete len:113 (+) Transcript_16244:513-851(+)